MNLKQYIPFDVKYKLHFYKAKFSKAQFFEDANLTNHQKKAFLFLAADYGNLGDVAITYAQTKFLEDQGYQVIEIPISKTAEGIWWVKKYIQPNDIVTLIGGGNMGDLYEQIETLRQLVIKQFPKQKIISFPQTFDFSESQYGQKRLSKAKNTYQNHNKLTLVAREQVSFELMKANFLQNNIIQTPDIVLTLKDVITQSHRRGAVICLRDDKEKSIDNTTSQKIIDGLKQYYNQDICYRDTHINENNLSIEARKKALNDIWQDFGKAEIVVTDRLHGMIFAYITQTPCIVLTNNNHKIKGTYQWIEGCGYIKFLPAFEEERFMQYLTELQSIQPKLLNLNSFYEPLIKEL
nr:polysaccharide pyruvyl transferase family protein [Moraxella sp. CTOTU48717]